MREVVQNALRILRACGPPVDNKNNQDNLDARFKTLEEKINAIAIGIKTPKGQTWASVTAAPAVRALPTAQRASVRVRIADAEGKTPTELLAAVKPVI